MGVRKAAVTLGVVIASTLSVAVPAQASSKNYRTYLGCGKYAGNSSSCYQGDGFGAILEAKHRHRRFKHKICVKGPGGHKWCDKRHTNRGGRSFVDLTTKFNNDLGKYRNLEGRRQVRWPRRHDPLFRGRLGRKGRT